MGSIRQDTDARRLRELVAMLRYMRPMGSDTEAQFRADYLYGLPDVALDDCGNLHVLVPMADGSASRVLWSCHTDTVHKTEGFQALHLSRKRITLDRGSPSNCLGADDTVGVWLCREMIAARVPGHYVFHYGEEYGGVGSRNVVLYHPEYFTGIEYAIALDRAGTRDVITHQAMDRCCSDAFAESLAAQLPGHYVPCNTGVYTDTAEYTGIIGECTNLSVGYDRQHSPHESQDYRFALKLCAALCRFDESLLCAPERLAGESDYDDDIRAFTLGWGDVEDVEDGLDLTQSELDQMTEFQYAQFCRRYVG